MTLSVTVVWPGGRRVGVHFRGIPELGLRGEDDPRPAPREGFLSLADVDSQPAFHEYLRKLTRLAADGSTLPVAGLESTVFALFDLLELEGVNPPPPTVRLEPV